MVTSSKTYKVCLMTMGQLNEIISFSWIIHALFQLAFSHFREENLINRVNAYACIYSFNSMFSLNDLFISQKASFVCLFGFFFLVSLVDWKLINIRIREKFNKFAQKQYAIAKNVYEYESDESVTLTIFEKVRNKMVYIYLHARLQLLFIQIGSKIKFL